MRFGNHTDSKELNQLGAHVKRIFPGLICAHLFYKVLLTPHNIMDYIVECTCFASMSSLRLRANWS